jgi:hypothetical protein
MVGCLPDGLQRSGARCRIVAFSFLFLALMTLAGRDRILPAWAVSDSAASVEREADARFKSGDYAAVGRLFRSLPAEASPSNNFIRIAFESAVRTGQTGEALTLYRRLHPSNEI